MVVKIKKKKKQLHVKNVIFLSVPRIHNGVLEYILKKM